MEKQEIRKLLDRDTKPTPFVCMYPSCEKTPVRTHSVSRSWFKQISDEKNRAVALRTRYETYFDSDGSKRNTRREGTKLITYNTNRLSTCFCFCSFHDGSVFAGIDNFQDFEISKKSAFLLAYRSICHEICVKRQVHSNLSNVSIPAHDALIFEMQKRQQATALEFASQDHNEMEDALRRQDFRDTRYFAIVIDSVPDILCSGFFAPVDEENVRNQVVRSSWLYTPYANARLALTVMPYQRDNGIIVLSWYGKSRMNKDYIRTLRKMSRNTLANHLFVTVFQYLENFYLRPSFWDSLSEDKQESLHRRFEADINPAMTDTYQSVRSNTTKYVNWSVEDIKQNVL
ncbi:MAG: hypothetical protein OXH77_03445 [Anaerolineaceae bacterium]|nr:hypothetical protein [Anaerolineaceae bacterium]